MGINDFTTNLKKAIKKSGAPTEGIIKMNKMAKKSLSEEQDCEKGMYWCKKSKKCKPIKNRKETEEASSAGGAGGYVGPLFSTKKKIK